MGPLDFLAEQHRQLEERFTALEPEEGGDSADERREQAEALVALLRLHTHLEERHLYPLLARVQGRDAAHQEAEDHLTMRELMDELEEQTPDAPEWWACLVALEDLLVAHVREEEEQHFSSLGAVLTAREQDELLRALEATGAELTSQARSWLDNPPLPNAPSWDV
jgi:hemerythrin-like domain-containing protein